MIHETSRAVAALRAAAVPPATRRAARALRDPAYAAMLAATAGAHRTRPHKGCVCAGCKALRS